MLRVDDSRPQVGGRAENGAVRHARVVRGLRVEDHFGLREDPRGAWIEDVLATESAFPEPGDRVAPATGDIGHVALEPDTRYFGKCPEGGRAQGRAGERFAEDFQEPFDRRAAAGRGGRRG